MRQMDCPAALLDDYGGMFALIYTSTYTVAVKPPPAQQLQSNISPSTFPDQLSQCSSSDDADSEIDSNNDDLSSNFSNNSNSKRQKRGILPKHATSVMRAWLFQHLVVSLSTINRFFSLIMLKWNNDNLTHRIFNIFSIHIRLKMRREPLLHKQISHCYK